MTENEEPGNPKNFPIKEQCEKDEMPRKKTTISRHKEDQIQTTNATNHKAIST